MRINNKVMKTKGMKDFQEMKCNKGYNKHTDENFGKNMNGENNTINDIYK